MGTPPVLRVESRGSGHPLIHATKNRRSPNSRPSAQLVLADVAEPDLIVLDIGLPDLEGYEVARSLRADPTPPGAPWSP